VVIYSNKNILEKLSMWLKNPKFDADSESVEALIFMRKNIIEKVIEKWNFKPLLLWEKVFSIKLL
jgi:hypothetical protein